VKEGAAQNQNPTVKHPSKNPEEGLAKNPAAAPGKSQEAARNRPRRR
jgi:hypothetical protein